MTGLTADTDVFESTRITPGCVVAFLARRISPPAASFGAALAGVLAALATEGWRLSSRAMIVPEDQGPPMALDAGFSSGIDIAGTFEAPSIRSAFIGVNRLELAGWSRLFTTEWLIGPREFAPVRGAGDPDRQLPWGFLALWEWNDAWAVASPGERLAYDRECDVAFRADLGLGIDITGRHRLDWAHGWHHLGAWEAPSLEAIDLAMRGHEAADDFKFTTSRHIIGRIRPLSELLDAAGGRA